MANTITPTAAAASFYDLCEADKAERAYWAVDRACAGEALQPGDNAAMLFALGLIDHQAQALRAVSPLKGGAA